MGCIVLVRCVLVLRCGLAGVVWYRYAGWSTSASACIGLSLFNYSTFVEGFVLEEKSIDGVMQTTFYEAKLCLKIAIVLHFLWKNSVSNLNKTYNIVYEVYGKGPFVK